MTIRAQTSISHYSILVKCWPMSSLTLALIVTSAALFALRRAWPTLSAYQHWIEKLFLFVWVCSAFARLNDYFLIQSGLHVEISWWWCAVASIAWACPVLYIQGRGRRWVGIGLVLSAMALAVADIPYFRLYGTIWSLDLYHAVGRLIRHAGLAVPLLSQISLKEPGELIAECLLVACFLPLPSRRLSDPEPVLIRNMALVAVLGSIGLLGVRISGGFKELYGISEVISEGEFIQESDLWTHHVFLLLRDLNEIRQRHVPLMNSEEKSPPNAQRTPLRAAARGYNVILICAPSLQEYVIGARVLGQEVTPYLNAWRQEALHFSQFFAQSQEGRLIDAEFIALTSLHALPHGSIAFLNRHESWTALPQVLRQKGYYTFSMHADSGIDWNEKRLQERYGFQESIFNKDLLSVRPEERESRGMADEVFMERAIPRLRGLPQPFFASLTPILARHPFRRPIPEHFRYLTLGPLETSPIGRYLQEMREFDFALEEFVHAIEQSGLRDHTLIAVYGDPDGFSPSSSEVIPLVEQQMRNPNPLLENLRVPFFISSPHSGLRGDRQAPGGQLDIAPTLLALLGIDSPPTFVGRTLVGAPSPAVAFRGGLALDETWIWIPARPEFVLSGCIDFSDRRKAPASQCDDLLRKAKQQLDLSDSLHHRYETP